MIGGWQFNLAPWALAVSGLFLAASLWFFLRAWRRGENTFWLAALRLLRLALSALIALTFLRPERVEVLPRARRPHLSILWDASGSMETEDVLVPSASAISRAAWIREQLASNFWKELERKFEVSVEPFSAPPAAPTGASAEELGTDLAAPLAAAPAEHPNLRAVLLLSDGDWNLGHPPVTAASALGQNGIPVFTIGVGSDRYLPDVDLESAVAPAYGLSHERIAVAFSVRNHLSRELNTTISILEDGRVIGEKKLNIPAEAAAHDTLAFIPREDGDHQFTVRVPVEPEEVFRENNQRTFRVSIRAEQLRVLLVESEPRWEFRYLKNALQRDRGVLVHSVLYRPGVGMGEGVGYLPEFPATWEDLQSYDVVFLGDVGLGEGMLTAENVRMLKDLVEKQAAGLVFLPGPLGYERSLSGSELRDLLPVELDPRAPAGFSVEEEARFELTLRGRDHWLTMLASDADTNQAIWRTLPGFFWYAPVVRVRPGAEVLAVHDSARNQFGRIPLLAIRNAGNGKTLFMGADSAWRWRKGVEDTYHYRFWGQVVRWMAHQRHLAEDDALRFFYSPEHPRAGDRVQLNAASFEKVGGPDAATATVTLVSPAGAREVLELTRDPSQSGLFSGAFVPREGGTYAAEVSVGKGGHILKSAIEVTVPTREKLGAPAKLDVLREIAAVTGGRFGVPADLASTIADLQLLPERQPEERRFRLWCDPRWCAALFALFAAYWIGRKLGGLT